MGGKKLLFGTFSHKFGGKSRNPRIRGGARLLIDVGIVLSRQKVHVKLEYRLITSKQIKLQSCAKSQNVRNSFALLYLM